MWSNQYIIIFVSLLHDIFLYSYSWYAVKCQQCRQVMLFEKLLYLPSDHTEQICVSSPISNKTKLLIGDN